MLKSSSQLLWTAGAVALASTGLVGISVGQTVSVTTAVGNGASTYIANDSNSEASSPNGSAGYTITRYYNTSGGYEDISLFRFDLTGLVPSGMYITNPTQHLYGIYGYGTVPPTSTEGSSSRFSGCKLPYRIEEA